MPSERSTEARSVADLLTEAEALAIRGRTYSSPTSVASAVLRLVEAMRAKEARDAG